MRKHTCLLCMALWSKEGNKPNRFCRGLKKQSHTVKGFDRDNINLNPTICIMAQAFISVRLHQIEVCTLFLLKKSKYVDTLFTIRICTLLFDLLCGISTWLQLWLWIKRETLQAAIMLIHYQYWLKTVLCCLMMGDTAPTVPVLQHRYIQPHGESPTCQMNGC